MIRIVAITQLDNDGNIVVKYMYDAWGVCNIINRILRFSDISNPLMDFYHKTSVTIIPTLLHYKTKVATIISKFFENF